MIDPASFLDSLESEGIKLWIDGEKLRYSAPQGAITPERLDTIKSWKPKIIETLQSREWPVPDAAGVRTLPASYTQLRFWTLQNANPTEAFYNVPFAFRLRGHLDIAKLQASLDAMVARHEILRTTLHEVDGKLMQVIGPKGKLAFHFVQGSADPFGALQTEMERSFDLLHQPGLRATLVEMSEEEHLLQFCFHNTVYDQHSLLVFLDDLSNAYSASLAGPAKQYRHSLAPGVERATSTNEERITYWQNWFSAGDPPAWNWVPKKDAPQTPSFHTHMPRQKFSPEVTRQLKSVSGRQGATLYNLLLAAYAILLRRYTGCFDVTVGTTHSNRDTWHFSGIMGPTIDVPALRIDTSENPTFPDLLADVRRVLLAALKYQDVPWALMASQLSPPRKPTGPLFRMVFSFFPETAHDRLKLPGVDVEYLEFVVNELSRPDLYLVLWEDKTPVGEELTGYWMHKRDVFELETAKQMNRDWAILLAEIARSPDRRVEDLL